MPVHNGMPYVAAAAASILEQSYGDFEFVIGDDGSSDGTTEVLESLANSDPRIQLLRRDGASGLATSANWLVSQTRTPLIAVMHADDIAHPERLGSQVAVLRANAQVQLVGTLWNGIDEAGHSVRPADFWRLLRRSAFAPFSHSSIMMRRSAFDQAGGYRTQAEYWEDLDLYYRIARLGPIVTIPQVYSTVRHARVSTRLRDDQDKVEGAVDLMFRAVAAHSAGGDIERVIAAGPHRGKLEPMTFVSCGSTNLWGGRSPKVLQRLLTRSKLGLNGRSFHALTWALWGTLSHRSLRKVLRAVLHLRNAAARPLLRGKQFVRWL